MYTEREAIECLTAAKVQCDVFHHSLPCDIKEGKKLNLFSCGRKTNFGKLLG